MPSFSYNELLDPSLHPLPAGAVVPSLGGHYVMQVIGPVSRLYDREELPWPSSSLVWRGKQPSWRRIGRRFVADLSSRRSPSYSVRCWNQHGDEWNDVVTFSPVRLSQDQKIWWTGKAAV